MEVASEFKINVWQGGKIVAVATGSDPDTVHRAAAHLALGHVMSGLGPISIRLDDRRPEH